MRLYVSQNQLKITANNPEQEEAEEILDVSYDGAEMEIGFNVSYVLDVLNALKCEDVRLLLTDSVSSVQIEDGASRRRPTLSCQCGCDRYPGYLACHFTIGQCSQSSRTLCTLRLLCAVRS